VVAIPKIDALVTPFVRGESPGCAVAVMQDGHVIHSRGYGLADLEHGVPITPTTVFHAASLSKQFTAFAVLALAADGRLSLDDDVRKHAPDAVPDFGARITLRHLLHHTSGLRDQWRLLRLAGWRAMDEKTTDDVLEFVQRQKDLNFRPGEDFLYCNTGYTLLATVVERVSGTSLRDFASERIFQPLRMEATRFRADHRDLVKARAFGYADDGDGIFRFWVPNFDLIGSTSLHTTVEDLLRWARNLMEPRTADAGIVEDILRPGALNDGTPVGYGAGVGIAVHRGVKIVRHSGWDLGYEAHLAVYPDERFAVAILGNLSTLRPALMARRIAEVRLADRFTDPPPPRRNPPEAELLQEQGLYRHPLSGIAWWVRLSEGVLRTGPALDVSLDPLGARKFRGPDEVTEVAFDGTTMSIRDEFGVVQRFERVASWVPGSAKLAAYAGTYRSLELDATLTFEMAGDALRVGHPKWPPTTASPAHKDAFTDDTVTYMFTRNPAGAVDRLTLSLERAYHLRFDRV
jgi:CubicO group peptidase (beta-lactamase class C family)